MHWHETKSEILILLSEITSHEAYNAFNNYKNIIASGIRR